MDVMKGWLAYEQGKTTVWGEQCLLLGNLNRRVGILGTLSMKQEVDTAQPHIEMVDLCHTSRSQPAHHAVVVEQR